MNFLRKLCTALTTCTLLLAAVAANAAQCTVYINDIPLCGEYTERGKYRIPVREFFESTGYTVQWIDENKEVVVYNADTSIVMFADRPYLFIDKSPYIMDDIVTIENDILMMPAMAPVTALSASSRIDNGVLYLTSDKVEDDSSWSYDVFNLINDIRRQYGLDEFVWNGNLASAALYRCEDMANRGYFEHTSPDGVSPFDVIRAYGVTFSVAAENIAAGQASPEKVVEDWMNSEGHRENILDPQLRELGVAFTRGGEYGIYWAQEFATTY